MNRRYAILTTGRQDYGILRSTILGMVADNGFEPIVLAGGLHFPQTGGLCLLEADRVQASHVIDFIASPPEVLGDTARAVEAVGRAVTSAQPEALILAGDRSETVAAALAAVLVGVPVVHFHGGEETEGAFDNSLRHAITKLSHLHFVTHEVHAKRVAQMGEPVGTIHIIPPPGNDNLRRSDLPTRVDVLEALGASGWGETPIVVVTVHPTTLTRGGILEESTAVSEALASLDVNVVVTAPNSDPGGADLAEFWRTWVRHQRGRARFCGALGDRLYWGLLRICAVVVGNSSSGLIEAPAAGAAVVNVGDRQRGRMRFGAVVDAPPVASAVAVALQEALSTTDRRGRSDAGAELDTDLAWPIILEVLRNWRAPRPPRKSFLDLDGVGGL